MIFVSVSCYNLDKGFEMGSQDVVPANTDVLVIDTITMNSYTVKADSMVTSGFKSALVGLYQPTNEYMDAYLGTDTVSSYFMISQPLSEPVLNTHYPDQAPTTAIYDSAVLVLRHSHYWYGDTTLPFTVVVHHLTQPLNYKFTTNFDGLKYNVSRITTGDQNSPVLGSKTYYPYPSSKYNVFVRLDDQFGKYLFDQVDSLNPLFISSNTTLFPSFVDTMKGFLLTPGTQPSAVLGFVESDSSMTIRIYYHGNAPPAISDVPFNGLIARSFDFKVHTTGTLSNLQFTRYIPNAPYPLNTLKYQNYEVSTHLTNSLSYVQSATGYMTRLEFPTLINILNSIQNIRLISATLYIVPQRQSFRYYELPTNISIYQSDNANDVVQLVTSTGTSPTYKLYTNKLNQETPAYYALDVTAFVNSILTSTGGLSNSQIPALLIAPTTSGTSGSLFGTGSGSINMDRLIIDNHLYFNNTNGINSTGLTITYWRY